MLYLVHRQENRIFKKFYRSLGDCHSLLAICVGRKLIAIQKKLTVAYEAHERVDVMFEL